MDTNKKETMITSIFIIAVAFVLSSAITACDDHNKDVENTKRMAIQSKIDLANKLIDSGANTIEVACAFNGDKECKDLNSKLILDEIKSLKNKDKPNVDLRKRTEVK